MKNFTFDSDQNFQLIIVLSLISRHSIKIKMKHNTSCAISFIKELSALIPGIKYELKGGNLEFNPGPLISGKKKIQVKNIPNFVYYFSIIAPFMKENSVLELSGITNSSESIDMLKTPLLKIFELFKIKGYYINISKRGFGPRNSKFKN